MPFFRLQNQARRRSLRLLLLYAAAVVGTVFTVSAVLGSLLLLGWSRADPFWSYAAPALLLTLMTVALSLQHIRHLGDEGAAVAEALGGELLQRQAASFAERRLLNVVAETAVAAGVAVPPVYLLRRDHSINAFAAGANGREVLGFTRGALVQLNRDELQAITAHEFSHIRHGDTRLNQRLCGWLFGLQGISSSGRYLLHGRDDADDAYRRRKNVDNHPFDNALEILLQALHLQLLGGLLLVLGGTGSLFAGWVQAAVSRQREFLADASAVQYTRQSAPLVSALCKTAQIAAPCLYSSHAAEYAHMMFAGITRSRLQATHPPVLERIRRLDPVAARRLAPQLEAWEADGLTLFPHYGSPQHFAPPQAGGNSEGELAQQEVLYRQREALMRARIKRHRASVAKLPLSADWQAAGEDGEYASAALLSLFQAHRLPEAQLRAAGLSTLVMQQLQRLSRQHMRPDAELLEHLLPAWVMQDNASQQAVLDIIRTAMRQQPPAANTVYLWLLLKAYLAPVPKHGQLPSHPAAAPLADAARLPPPALQAAVKAALLLSETAKTELLRPVAPTLAVNHPLLWRFLCVCLDLGAWHFGI